jgi:hypothetical protein
MQTIQLVNFLSIFNAPCLQTSDGMGRKVFGWELNTPQSKQACCDIKTCCATNWGSKVQLESEIHL